MEPHDSDKHDFRARSQARGERQCAGGGSVYIGERLERRRLHHTAPRPRKIALPLDTTCGTMPSCANWRKRVSIIATPHIEEHL